MWFNPSLRIFIVFVYITDPDLTDFGFNGLCLLANNQPRSGLKFVSVKENSVGGGGGFIQILFGLP